jgi:hypothetical protein
VIDLGVHCFDLALWTLDFSEIKHVVAQPFAAGALVPPAPASRRTTLSRK